MDKRIFKRLLSFLMALALCEGMIPAAQAAEKEELQLYMRNGDSGSFSADWEFREDQGMPYACFSTIITNPRLVNRDDSETLGIDNTLKCMILNSEAAELRISGDALAALTGTTDISVLDSNEEEIAVWTFEGEE